jgi:hypothetical protein
MKGSSVMDQPAKKTVTVTLVGEYEPWTPTGYVAKCYFCRTVNFRAVEERNVAEKTYILAERQNAYGVDSVYLGIAKSP